MDLAFNNGVIRQNIEITNFEYRKGSEKLAMKKLITPENEVEANVIKSILEEQGICAEIKSSGIYPSNVFNHIDNQFFIYFI